MNLEKVQIHSETGTVIKAMYNPERYTVNKSVQYAEIGIPGLDSPVLQFVRGQNERVTMDLFFDTTDQGMANDVQDVRKLTKDLYNLLKINSETHAPPRAWIVWGDGGQFTSYGSSITPWVVLESLSEEFTLFNPSGIPLRARVSTTWREAWTIEEQLQETPRHSADRTKVRRVLRGETLSYVAGSLYGDPRQWRALADANSLDDPRRLSPGLVLKVPPLPPGGSQ
jgi:nucleoid-associated protein YgaU